MAPTQAGHPNFLGADTNSSRGEHFQGDPADGYLFYEDSKLGMKNPTSNNRRYNVPKSACPRRHILSKCPVPSKIQILSAKNRLKARFEELS